MTVKGNSKTFLNAVFLQTALCTAFFPVSLPLHLVTGVLLLTSVYLPMNVYIQRFSSNSTQTEIMDPVGIKSTLIRVKCAL